MQIVIEIPIEQYISIVYEDIDKLRKCVKNGTILTKCEDAISREALLKKQYRIDDSATLSTRDVVNVEDIEDAPPVTPSRRKGHWIKCKNDYECSECGGRDGWHYDYCHDCGAEMENI